MDPFPRAQIWSIYKGIPIVNGRQTSAKSEKSRRVHDKFRLGSPETPPELKNCRNDVYRYVNNNTSQIFDFRSQFFFTTIFVKVPFWHAKTHPIPIVAYMGFCSRDFRFFKIFRRKKMSEIFVLYKSM